MACNQKIPLWLYSFILPTKKCVYKRTLLLIRSLKQTPRYPCASIFLNITYLLNFSLYGINSCSFPCETSARLPSRAQLQRLQRGFAVGFHGNLCIWICQGCRPSTFYQLIQNTRSFQGVLFPWSRDRW